VKHWLNNLAKLQKKSKESKLVRNFRVKGEVGCFTIPLYGDLEGFGPQRSLQHYRTSGYRRVILHQGITKSSYRTVCSTFNHTVRQEKELGIKPSGVRYEATVEAREIETALSDKTAKILQEYDFEPTGQPSNKAAVRQLNKVQKRHQTSPTKLKKAYEEIVAQANETIQPLLDFDQLRADDYEQVKQTTYIGLDDVCNKRQKADRSSDTPAPIDDTNNRKGHCRLLLDWYHLRKKIHGQMYMGLQTNDRRDTVLLHVEQLLWYGLINQAIEYINQIPKQQIKDKERLF